MEAREEKVIRPVVSIVLSIVGGVIIYLLSWYFNSSTDMFWWAISGGTVYGFQVLLGAVCMAFLFVAASVMYRKPNESRKWGKAVIVFSLISLLSNSLGGLGVGVVLGVIAGASAIRWGSEENRPKAVTPV